VLAATLADVATLPAQAKPKPKPSAPACPDERADQVSALVTARLCNKRVEISGATTETTKVFANPGGTVTAQVAAGPVRFRDGERWVDIDLTLKAAADGTVRPVAHPKRLQLSGPKPAGTGPLASLSTGDDTLHLDWAGALPAPTLDGARATYPEVQPGVDLAVEATPAGFEQFLIVKDRAAAARVRTLNLPLRSGKLRFVQDAGGVAINDAAGRRVGRVPTPVGWDAATSPEGLRGNERPLQLRAARPGGRPRAAGSAEARAAAATDNAVELQVTADPAWLDDPATRYPVTLDPAVSLGPIFDTYVKEGDPVNRAGYNDLQFGWGNNLARAFLQWNTSAFAGGRIRSARMNFWNFYSSRCSAERWELWSTDAFDANTPMFWHNQPALRHLEASSTETKGLNASCADGWVGIDARTFFQRAADAGSPVGYMGLKAGVETAGDNRGWKQFRSSNSAPGQVPHVTVEYDAAPIVSNLTTSPATSGCVTGEGRPWISSATPRLQATVADADTGNVNVTFEWATAGGASIIGSQTITGVASNTAPSVTVPAGAFADGGSYAWRVRATDGTHTSPSRWCEFSVDTTRPGVPFVSSALYPSTATDNGWGHGGYGQAGQFTFTPATGNTDVVAYVYQLDSDTAPTTLNAANPTTVSITPREDGRRTLTVRAKDRAGQLSEPNTYTFNVGRAGLKQPQPGANVIKRMKLAIDGDATYNRVRFQYRRGPGGAEYDVPLANLRTASGGSITTDPVRLADLGGHAVWDAVDTLGTTGGVVQVRGYLYSDTSTAPGYPTQWVTVTVDPDGDRAASSDIGPGGVNLLTGDYSVASTDADELGLSVARASSSRKPADGWLPQGERLPANQQQVSDLAGFTGGGTTTVNRVTNRGQGSSTDALEIIPFATSPGPGVANGDVFASVGGDQFGGLRHGMKTGRRYRFTGWIYVPAATGLDPVFASRGLRVLGVYRDSAGNYREVASPKAAWVDGWQELSVDLTIPAGATEAFFRLYSGMPFGSNKAVYWDNLSLREVVAPFGPQWRGGVDGGVADVDYETLTFPSPDLAKITNTGGGWFTFGRSTSGAFFPEPGAEDLTLTRVSDTVYELRELDGAVTQFTRQGEAFVVTTTWTAEQNSTTRYLYESADNRTLVKRVVNATEPGVGDCTTPVPARGCEVLEYDYAAATTATATAFGDHADRVRAVKLWSWDPVAAVQSAVEVARYAYDDQGRLREVWDPRLAQPIKTGYDYDAAGRVTRVGAGGQLPWMFDYGTIAGDDNAGRLLRVRRAALRPGTRDQLDGEVATNVVYRVPLTTAAGGPHDMDAAAVARWGQKDLPTDATAIFGPEATPGVNAATQTAPGSGGYGLATITYLNASAQDVNTAAPGGHIDSQSYDEFGNVVWQLEASNRALALGQLPDADSRAAALGLPAGSAYRAAMLSLTSRYSPDGLDLVEMVGPVVRTVLEGTLVDTTGARPTLAAGSEVVGRIRVQKSYDEGKPDGAAYHLVTAETKGLAVAGYPDADVRTTRYGYDAEKGGASGWSLKKPTMTVADAGPGGASIAAYSSYDAAGRVLSVWSGDAGDAGARVTVTAYYTAGANSADPACGERPQWAGKPCTTGPAGAVTGHDASRAPGWLPARRVEEYSRTGEVTRMVESAGGRTRRTVTVHDGGDRVIRTETTVDEGQPLPASTVAYDPASGQVARTTFGDVVISQEHDLLGRVIRYADADGGVTTTEYNRFNKPARIVDSTGSTTLEYDLGQEPRGFVTSVTDSVAGRFGARYSPDGQLVEATYPGGLTRRDTLDPSFTPVQRVYARDSDGTVMYSESVTENSHGQWIRHSYTGGSRTYGYDRLGRLTSAAEVTGAGACTTRSYTYDRRSNRTAKRDYRQSAGGCGTEQLTSEQLHAYDSADRLVDPGYSYDAFGRTTAMPGGVTLGYYANDLLASQQQGEARQRWTLDGKNRYRGSEVDRLTGGVWSTERTRTYHYGDDSDRPRWVSDNAGTGGVTRFVSGPDADLVAITSAGGNVRLQLTNLHGDVALSVDPQLTSPEFYAYDEYGVPAGGAAELRYGWLGGKHRSSETLGDLVLMGVRVYAPALGRFLQTDPQPGGSCNAYEYVCGDPVNGFDLDGRKKSSFWSKAGKWWDKYGSTITTVATVVAMLPIPVVQQVAGAIAVVGSVVSAARAWQNGDKKGAIFNGLGAIPGAGALVKTRNVVNVLKIGRQSRCPYCGQRGLRSHGRWLGREYRKQVRSFRRWDNAGWVAASATVGSYAQEMRFKFKRRNRRR
jgi:RHS repeat-associated protein